MICMHVHNTGIHVDTRECEILLGYKAKEVLADIIVLIRSLVCTGGPDTVRLPARLYVAIDNCTLTRTSELTCTTRLSTAYKCLSDQMMSSARSDVHTRQPSPAEYDLFIHGTLCGFKERN